MVKSIIYFLPCLVSLLWFVSFCLKVKTQRQKLFMWTELTASIYFVAFGIYLYPETDYYMLVRMEPFCMPMALCMATGYIVYLQMLRTKRELNRTLLWVLLVPAIMQGTIVATIYYILGFERAAEVGAVADKLGYLPEEMNSPLNKAYCLFAETEFTILAAIYIMLVILSCVAILHKEHYRPIDTWSFLFKGMETTNSRLIASEVLLMNIALIPMIYPGRLYMIDHIEVGMLLTILVCMMKHCISHTEFYSLDNRKVTLYSLSHLRNELLEERKEEALQEAINIQEQTENKQVNIETKETETKPDNPQESELKDLHLTKKSKLILEMFNEKMKEEKIWKDENLNLSMLCEMLDVSRGTLSAILNMEYGIPFREIVNHYRIEEAKTFMQENPKATQETVAEYCGFKNAQYFNTKFKEVMGETPQMWLTSQKK